MTEQASFARRYFFQGFLVGEVIERKKGGNVLCCACKPHPQAEQPGNYAVTDQIHGRLRHYSESVRKGEAGSPAVL